MRQVHNAKLEKQKIQIENMIQALLHARKRLFGPSSEITRQAEGQMTCIRSSQWEFHLTLRKKTGISSRNRLIEGGNYSFLHFFDRLKCCLYLIQRLYWDWELK